MFKDNLFFYLFGKRYFLDYRVRKCWLLYFRVLIRIFCLILIVIVEICLVGVGLVKIVGVEIEFFFMIDDFGVFCVMVSNK